jgi:hypothetical protein
MLTAQENATYPTRMVLGCGIFSIRGKWQRTVKDKLPDVMINGISPIFRALRSCSKSSATGEVWRVAICQKYGKIIHGSE